MALECFGNPARHRCIDFAPPVQKNGFVLGRVADIKLADADKVGVEVVANFHAENGNKQQCS